VRSALSIGSYETIPGRAGRAVQADKAYPRAQVRTHE